MVSGRPVSAALAGTVAALGLAIPSPGLASPVFVDADTALVNDYSVSALGGGCTHVAVPPPDQTIPVVENGGPVSMSTSISGTASGPTPGDTANVSANATATASVSSANGLPRSMDFTISGHTALVTAQPVSACKVKVDAEVVFNLRLVLNASGYLTVNATNDAHSFIAMSLDSSEAAVDLSLDAFGWGSEHQLRVRVAPGTYTGLLDGSIGTQSFSSDAGQGAAQAHVTFTAFGALTSAPAGAGAHYVDLPSAAGCASGTLDARITTKHRRAAKLRQLRFFLGDRLVTKVRHPKRGAVVHVPLDPASPSQLRAEVTLARSGHHHHPRTHDVAAAYEACT